MDFLVVLDVVSSGTRISSESIIAYFFREKSFFYRFQMEWNFVKRACLSDAVPWKMLTVD